MNQSLPTKQLSDTLSNSIGTLYKLEGFGLVFTFIGTLFLMSALFVENTLIRYIMAALGSIIILVVLYFFYMQDIKPRHKDQQNIQKNKEMIDTFQDAALKMSELAYDLHKISFTYAQEIAEFIIQYQQRVKEITQLLNVLKVPGRARFGQLADNAYVTRASDLSTSILHITHETEVAMKEIHLALVTLDIAPIKKYRSQIVELDQKLKELQQTMDSSLQQGQTVDSSLRQSQLGKGRN